MLSSLLALALSALSANAWHVTGVVSCPNGNSAEGIMVCVDGVGCAVTSANGAYFLALPDAPGNYTICVDPSSLPAGATVSGCDHFKLDANTLFATIDFTLGGDFCSGVSHQGPCWLTGGGTVNKIKGTPEFSYGGVVNPGCSPIAGEGGNWNVVDHARGLHFQGKQISVISCSGVPTKSPKVNVNIIDFMGTGTLTGIGGNPTAKAAVCFIGHAEDHNEPGGGNDMLYINVFDCTTGASLLLISGDHANPSNVVPLPISTGNLQIHTSSCDK